MNKKLKKYLSRPPKRIASDVIFWGLIILLIIPSTRSVFLGAFAKVRTAVFTQKIKTLDGPMLSAGDYQWTFTDLDGNQMKLEDFKGEVLFVNSWATWCPPCRAEMPSIEKLYKNNGLRDGPGSTVDSDKLQDNANGVRMLMISNEDLDVVREFIEKKEYTFPVYLTKTALPAVMQSRSIPASFVFNKQGKLVYQKNGAFNWNGKKMRNFFDRLNAE
ncbi:MAG: TlpA family protein disulfide reductase [Bacteroidetes bacterium]|jgi:thiol-disulfide isomerase/thioredoxin|nr:TlpA family protein disulfide reductase [Bacteroidota bacterium]